MKNRIYAAGLFLSLLITCTFSACASGKAPAAASETTKAAAAETTKAAAAAVSSADVSAGAAQTAPVPENTAGSESPVLWPGTEMPVSLQYDRMWVYSAHGETDDPEILGEIVDAVRSLSVGEEADYIVEDYTDLLLFTFPDGSTYRLEFEEDNWVTEGQARLHVEGLPRLRALLDELLGDQAEK